MSSEPLDEDLATLVRTWAAAAPAGANRDDERRPDCPTDGDLVWAANFGPDDDLVPHVADCSWCLAFFRSAWADRAALPASVTVGAAQPAHPTARLIAVLDAPATTTDVEAPAPLIALDAYRRRLRTSAPVLSGASFARAASTMGKRREQQRAVGQLQVHVVRATLSAVSLMVDASTADGFVEGDLVAVELTAAAEPALFLSPLVASGDFLTASLHLATGGSAWELRMVEEPVDPFLLSAVAAEETARSAAATNEMGRAVWRTIAARLAPGHPLRQVIDDTIGS